jgi:2-(3-amino-3-carboxypropyl)histidine synthase
MEEDRLATNLGPEDAETLQTEATPASKQPKRRFVGRRTVEAAATTNAPNSSIEENTAIQGVKSHI